MILNFYENWQHEKVFSANKIILSIFCTKKWFYLVECDCSMERFVLGWIRKTGN